jgi:hypothetical protein
LVLETLSTDVAHDPRFMKRFARLSPGFSKKLECLEAACALFLAYSITSGEPGSRTRAALSQAASASSYDGGSDEPAVVVPGFV